MAERAVLYAERALEADEENFSCHKWMGIIISWSSEFQGTRRKIERSYDIRNHFQVTYTSALLYNSSDTPLVYLLYISSYTMLFTPLVIDSCKSFTTLVYCLVYHSLLLYIVLYITRSFCILIHSLLYILLCVDPLYGYCISYRGPLI